MQGSKWVIKAIFLLIATYILLKDFIQVKIIEDDSPSVHTKSVLHIGQIQNETRDSLPSWYTNATSQQSFSNSSTTSPDFPIAEKTMSISNVSTKEKSPMANLTLAGPESTTLNYSKVGVPDNQLTIIIQLSGEMGNHLSKIANGYVLKWILKEDYNITARTILRPQLDRRGHVIWKAPQAEHSLKLCFPNMRQLDFSEGLSSEFYDRKKQQEEWLGPETHSILHEVSPKLTPTLHRIEALKNVLLNDTLISPIIPPNATISLPYMLVDILDMVDEANDRYNKRLRELFRFDLTDPLCCKESAKNGEAAVHIRSFLPEMPRRGVKLGFEELTPNQTVNELLQEYSRGDKVAVIGRFPNFVQPYIDRMKEAGLDVRQLTNLTGEQAFGFLLTTDREIFGVSISSYANWAAYLGNASKATLYSIRSPSRLERFGEDGQFYRYNFTDPDLRKRMNFKLFNSEAQEQIDEEQKHKTRAMNQTSSRI